MELKACGSSGGGGERSDSEYIVQEAPTFSSCRDWLLFCFMVFQGFFLRLKPGDVKIPSTQLAHEP